MPNHPRTDGHLDAIYRRPDGVPTPASVFQGRNATAPVRPIPDGRIVVRTIYGKDHKFDYKDMPHGWKSCKEFLQISMPTGFRRFPWGQILWFDTVHNSDEYIEALRRFKEHEAAKFAKEADENGTCDA